MALPKRIARRINLVGIELEGGWIPQRDMKLKGDGSVHSIPSMYIPGELVSRPIPPTAVKTWIRTNHPDYTNRSCGLHVHMSLRSKLDFSRLMEMDSHVCAYERYLLSEIARWGRRANVKGALWDRLAGKNEYCCVGKCQPDQQVRSRGSRYTAANFCAYPVHGTVEIRVLPAFKSKRYAASAAHWVVRSTERYLRTRYPERKEAPIRIEMGAPSDVLAECVLPNEVIDRIEIKTLNGESF